MTRSIGAVARRYCFVVYWLIFALITLQQAQSPSPLADRERWHYPWRGVVEMWALLAVLVGVLHVILRPATYHHSWGRLLGALFYAAVLVVLAAASRATDLPAYYYVPDLFSLVTMVGMLTLALVEGVVALWRRARHAA